MPFKGLLTILVYLGMFIAFPAHASCERLSTEEQIEKSELVFIGKPTGKEYVGYQRAKLAKGAQDEYAIENGESPLWKWKINRFIVERALKGTVGSEVTVVSPRFFTIGSRYVVFAIRADNKSRFDKTTAGWANTPCEPADFINPDAPSSLVEDVEEHFGGMRLK